MNRHFASRRGSGRDLHAEAESFFEDLVGTPAQIVNHPATDFVAEFVDGIDLKRINTEASSPEVQLTRNLKIVS